MSRADYLEQVIRGNASPSIIRESSAISPDNIWTVDNAHPLMTQDKEQVHQAKTTVSKPKSFSQRQLPPGRFANVKNKSLKVFIFHQVNINILPSRLL
ncbi:hypothetical protein WA1_29105 [Scytonema hofmannii PCC 7110]|uniref:Uncharacterized protein n=1 Tax=Scytonema hofmannii PCC 7110 TaxID=128403 RepID=A0A139X5P3_9CYAN|nr:hypothetical protein [Scytonema hofmannii]KYC40018.1 hypothetical protein WA1_29105 [Scytonema hofmannii PCC 7110]